MSKKKEMLDKRFRKTIRRALSKKGEISLASIVESQYFFPRKYNIKPVIVEYKTTH
ncbi:hypothetical protein [Photobacterium damselae]|uniref:hypothetical protein n=1 Tax=Photobacterium damselae TaxID=38293 RepID=UPI0012FD3C37|nr:hypothetical protein [Photobacterium damselae]